MTKSNLGDKPAHVDNLVDDAKTGEVKKKIKIILEENENIPPTGQFISCNGEAYLITPGREVSVPDYIVEVLDNAVESFPVKDDGGNILYYKDKLRMPYRVVREK